MDAHSQWTGLDADRLERITDHMQRNYIGPAKIAGCHIAVARHGHIAYNKTFGTMDIERNRPTRDDTIYRMLHATVRDPLGHLQGACHVFGHAWALVRPDTYLAATGEAVDGSLITAVEHALGLKAGDAA